MLSLHGVLLEMMGKGVLITGKPGIGKSETALTLLSRGHRLVADDAPLFECKENQLIGTACAQQKGILCVRSLGLLDVTQLFGQDALLNEIALDCMIDLVATTHAPPQQPLEIGLVNKIVNEQVIPSISLSIASGHNLAILIESAVKLAFMPKSEAVKRLLAPLL